MTEPQSPPPPDIERMMEFVVKGALRGTTSYRAVVGGYLNAHVELERALDGIITAWFIAEGDADNAVLFKEAVLDASGMRFWAKLNVVRALLGNSESAKSMLRRIEAATQLRNKLAHRNPVFMDDDKTTFRFEPPDPKRPQMTLMQLRGALADLQRLDSELAEMVAPLITERRGTEQIRRAAMRRVMERFLTDFEPSYLADGSGTDDAESGTTDDNAGT